MNMKAIAPVLLSSLFLTGCVGVVPIPRFSNKPVAGIPIKPQQTEFIVAGETTRAEVVDRLGAHFRESPRVPALAYSWEMPGGEVYWWVMVPEGGDIDEFEWTRWRAFFVMFDDSGHVARSKFKRLSSRKSLDEQLEHWFASESRRSPEGKRPPVGQASALQKTVQTSVLDVH